MAVRTGFHRIGLVISTPFIVGSAAAFCVGLFLFLTLPAPGFQVTGPDRREWSFSATATEVEITQHLTREYQRPITIGFGDNQVWPSSERRDAIETATAWLAGSAAAFVFALLLYAICWAFGWIINGFRSAET
jgi:hypothetical protein